MSMSDELEAAFDGLLAELNGVKERLKSAEPPLDERERVEGYRWAFALLETALDVYVRADAGRPRFSDIVGPYRKWGGDNADAYYQFAPIDPRRSYRVRVQPGSAAYFSLTIYGGPNDGRYSNRIVASANDRTLQPAADGACELWLSPEPPPDAALHWLKLDADAVCAITRDYLADPVHGERAVWRIEAVDPPRSKLDDAATLARGFRAARVWLAEQARMCPLRVSPANSVQEPYPVPKQTFGWSAGDASYAMGSFELAEGQALLIEGRSPACAFWNLCLWNPYLHTYDYAYDRVTINGAQVQYEADGSWQIWIAAHDPGQPNWLATQGHARGLLWFRWFLPEAAVVRPRATLYGADGQPVVSAVSAERPAPLRLDDLAAPKFPDAMQPFVDMLATRAAELRIEPEALCAEAQTRTGLANWGNESATLGFRRRLDVLCRSLRDEANMSDFGKVMAFESIAKALVNRLRIEDLIAHHPEIEQEPLERPIIICGMPRTGTTHLHNLMSADPNLRHLPYWESLEPVLAEAERPAPGTSHAADPRLGACAQACMFMDGLLPHFKRMHEMTVEHAHEEIQLLANDISGMLFETMAHLPGWRDDYKAHDQSASYLYLRRTLQALSWLDRQAGHDANAPRRWLLKSPQHLEQFGPLLAAFPDATLVITHRDPVAVVASMATMVAYTRRLNTAQPDVPVIARYWAERATDLLDGCLAACDRLPAERTVHVRLDDFMADEIGTLKRIYAAADQPLEALSLARMAEYTAANPRGRHGAVSYDLKALGLDADEWRQRTRAYAERFGLRDEGLA
jgi:hypothetical protein